MNSIGWLLFLSYQRVQLEEGGATAPGVAIDTGENDAAERWTEKENENKEKCVGTKEAAGNRRRTQTDRARNELRAIAGRRQRRRRRADR